MSKSAECFEEKFSIESLGAASGIVTGSLHKLRHGESTIVIDAGIFQGKYDAFLPSGKSRNTEDLGNIKNVADILLTHAHADHVARLPLFYKKNCSPRTLTTEMTRELMEIILKDSAKIQKDQDKLYTCEDVDEVLRHVSTIKMGKQIKVGNKHDHLTALWTYNGHIPGSASIIIEKTGTRGGILFTGDIGKEIQPICGGWGETKERDYPKDLPIKALWTESTSFDRESVNFDEKYEQFLGSINKILQDGGSVVIPAISMQRNQEIVEIIRYAQENGDIPQDTKIYKDAPLASKFEETYVEDADLFMTSRFGNDPEFYKNPASSKKRFELKNCQQVNSNKESVGISRSLLANNQNSIIVTSGGMLGFGRVRNYIDGGFGANPKNGIILTCYQVEGTEGRMLTDQGYLINKNGSRGAKIEHLNVFTGHVSGETDTFKYLNRFDLSQLELIGIIHGNDNNRKKMAETFKERGYPARVELPEIGVPINFSLSNT
ncbi:MAG: MBL fold metallo-hydrolase [Candidatus Shapirobacteria bacterium]|nr:MBL fold metallo-hydrolase [Candidatus Shapirobacteria bacterium]